MRRNQSSKEWREGHPRRDGSMHKNPKGETELGGSRSWKASARGEGGGL